MPQCKAPSTLKYLTINSIVRNLAFWTKDYEEKLLDKGRFRHILGPFDDIPSPMLIQELADELIQQQKMTRSSLHLLINGGFLQRLNLNECPRLITDEIIYMIAYKCKKVKTLNLAGCTRVTSQALEVLAPNLPFAVRLDFSKTRISPLALQTVFSLCADLQELTLKHCQVCDNDIGVLCNMAMQKDQCLLRKVDLSSTMVTDLGIRALLQSIPRLQEVLYSNLIQCILEEAPIAEEFEDQYLRWSSSPEDGNSLAALVDREEGQNCLQRLECSDFSQVTDHHLKLIALMCPKLVALDLQLAEGFSRSGLGHLLQLDNLRELKLASSEDLSFNDGLDSFLMLHGSQLRALSLENFDGLDLILVGQLCPYLRKLLVIMMSDRASFGTSRYTSNLLHPLFHYLEDLVLWCTNDNLTLTSNVLTEVFPQCYALRWLKMIRVVSFSDAILEEAIRSHGFPKLKSFELHECNAISSSSILRLLQDERNSLETLSLMGCFAITRRDYEGWRKLVKRRNYNITVAWK